MTNPDLCEIVVLLDRSGSMASIRDDMQKGFDTFIAEQRKVAGRCVVTLVQFDTGGVETVYTALDVVMVPNLNFVPRGSTPLLDAMGKTIHDVGERLRRLPESLRPGKVLFMVITDGQENASTEYTTSQIKHLVEQQTKTYSWQFVYLGANVDAFAEAGRLGFGRHATANYAASVLGVRRLYAGVSASVTAFRLGNPYTITDEQRAKMGKS